MAAYLDLFEGSTDPILLLSFEEKRVLDCNDASIDFFSVGTSPLIGKIFKDLAVIDPAVEKEFRLAGRRNHRRQCEFAWHSIRGTRLMAVQIMKLVLADKTAVWQLVGQDITDKRDAESAAARLMGQLEQANAKLTQLATTDELTGLYNFRTFKQRLALEHERARRMALPYSLLFIDVDHFKHFNDRNGHPLGDEVLRGVGELIAQVSRKSDLQARYGGEEFAVLCFAVSAEGAGVFAERLRQAIATHPFAQAMHQPLGAVTVSIGVSVFPEHGNSPEQILKKADEALYESKRLGRNRVTFASD